MMSVACISELFEVMVLKRLDLCAYFAQFKINGSKTPLIRLFVRGTKAAALQLQLRTVCLGKIAKVLFANILFDEAIRADATVPTLISDRL